MMGEFFDAQKMNNQALKHRDPDAITTEPYSMANRCHYNRALQHGGQNAIATSQPSRSARKTPYIIATGFTTAFLGDERSLREFIIGDAIKSALDRKGRNTILYLINDSYDPLNYRQLRVGVNKNAKLLSCFEPYCGRPISEVPDPFGCHENYSQHFAHALIKRLHSLDIYPVLLDSYHAYRKGYYADFISITFQNYSKIQEMLSQRFKNFSMKNLFRIQCPKCGCLDATHIFRVSGREVHVWM